MADRVIEIEDLSFIYPGGTKALDHVSLSVERGEYVVIMGANGAGKSTLCMFVNGVIPNVLGGRVAGSVRVAGLNTFEHHVYELARHVGMVLQDPETQLFTSDVRSEVAFAAENVGLPRDEILRRLEWALQVVRLAGTEERTPYQLSGGQKQRLAIAAGLVMQPQILVLDEPTSQLDPVGSEEVFSVLRELNRKLGMTILMASHKSEIVAQYADRIVLLEKGRKVLEGRPGEVLAQIDTLNRVQVQVPEVTLLEHRLGGRLPPGEISVTLAESQARLGGLLRTGQLVVAPQPQEAPAHAGYWSAPCHIEVRDLSYTYPGVPPVPALRGIDLSFRRGRFIALIGQNGSGKTTLVKNIIGVLKPTAGQVLLDGSDVAQLRVTERSRHIGLVLQNPDTQLFAMSAGEEVAFGLQKMGLPREEIQERVSQALQATGLTAFRDLYPFKFSFGDRRKLAVAAVVAMRPEVLIFDEPTTGQDYKGRYELTEIARELNQAGSTVIMVTHDMDLVARYAEWVIVMGEGRVLLEGPTAEVFSRGDVLAATYLKPPQISQLAQSLSEFGVASGILSVGEMLAVLR